MSAFSVGRKRKRRLSILSLDSIQLKKSFFTNHINDIMLRKITNNANQHHYPTASVDNINDGDDVKFQFYHQDSLENFSTSSNDKLIKSVNNTAPSISTINSFVDSYDENDYDNLDESIEPNYNDKVSIKKILATNNNNNNSQTNLPITNQPKSIELNDAILINASNQQWSQELKATPPTPNEKKGSFKSKDLPESPLPLDQTELTMIRYKNSLQSVESFSLESDRLENKLANSVRPTAADVKLTTITTFNRILADTKLPKISNAWNVDSSHYSNNGTSNNLINTSTNTAIINNGANIEINTDAGNELLMLKQKNIQYKDQMTVFCFCAGSLGAIASMAMLCT